VSKTSPAFRGYIVNEQWDTTFDANSWVVELTAPGTAEITTYEGRTVLYQTSGLDGDSTVKRTFDIGYYRTRFTACRMKAVIKVINGGYIDTANLSLVIATQKAGFLLSFVNDRIQYQSDEPGFPWKYYLMDTRDDFHTYEIVMKEDGKADVLVDDKLIWKDAVSTYGASNLIWFRATDGPDWYVDSAEYWYVHDTEIYWSKDGKDWRDITLEVSRWDLSMSVSRGADTLSIRFPHPWDRDYELRNTYLRLYRKGERAFHGRVNTYRKSFPANVLELEATEESVGFKQCIVVSKEYEDTELSAIVKDIIDYYNAQQGTSITKTNVETTSIVIHRAVFNEQSVFDILSHLAEISSYDFYLDAYNDFHFFRRKLEDTGIHLKEGESILSAEFEEDYEQVKTRVTVRGAMGTKSGFDADLCYAEREDTGDLPDFTVEFNSAKGVQKLVNTFQPVCSALKSIRLFPFSYDTANIPTSDFKLRLEETDQTTPLVSDEKKLWERTIPASTFIDLAGQLKPFNFTDETLWANKVDSVGHANVSYGGVAQQMFISGNWWELFETAAAEPNWYKAVGDQYWILTTDGLDIGSNYSGALVDRTEGSTTNVACWHSFDTVQGGHLVFCLSIDAIGDIPAGKIVSINVTNDAMNKGIGICLGGPAGQTLVPAGTTTYIKRRAWDDAAALYVYQDTTAPVWIKDVNGYWRDTFVRKVEFIINDTGTRIFIDGEEVSFTDGNEALINSSNFQRIMVFGNPMSGTEGCQVFLDHMIWLKSGESAADRYVYQTLTTAQDFSDCGLLISTCRGSLSASEKRGVFGLQLVNRGHPQMMISYPAPKWNFLTREAYETTAVSITAQRNYYTNIHPFQRDRVSELRIWLPVLEPYIVVLKNVVAQKQFVAEDINMEALDFNKTYALSLESDLDKGFLKFYTPPNSIARYWEREEEEWGELFSMKLQSPPAYFLGYSRDLIEPLVPIDCVVEINDLEAQVSPATDYGIKEISFEDPILTDEFDAKIIATNKLKGLVKPRKIGTLQVLADYADHDTRGKTVTITVGTLGVLADKYRIGEVSLTGSSRGVISTIRVSEEVEFEERDLATQLKVVMDKVKGREQVAELADTIKFRYWLILDLDDIKGLSFEGLTSAQYGTEKKTVKYGTGSLRCDHPGSTLAATTSGFYKSLTTQDWSAFTVIELWTYFPSAELHDLTLSDFEFKCEIEDAAGVKRTWKWNASVTDKWEKVLLSMKDVTEEGVGFDITQVKKIWLGVTVAIEPYSDWEHTVYYDQVMGLKTENPDIASLPVEIST